MGVVVLLEWTFSPPDYFEEPLKISRNDYTLTIADGKAEARIDSAIYDANPSMRRTLHESLNDRFLAVQLLSHRAYKLSNSMMTRLHPDGRRDFFLDAEPGRFVMSVGPVDFQIIDKNGKVLMDSKRDRIDKKLKLADLVSKHRATDASLSSLLDSYHRAVLDPGNELVHLYEIRDALRDKFGGESAAGAALHISTSDWSRLGQLCNDETMRQGRHRGKSVGALRDATEAELSEARRIAQAMIEAYLEYLDSTARSGGA